MFLKARIRRPSPGTVLGGLALIVAMSGVAVAAIPGGNGAVTACVSKDGEVKVIDAEAGATCKGSQATVKLASTDATGKVANADKLDGLDSTDFLGANAKAADSDKLDNKDSTEFLGATAKAADSEKLDGKNSTDFVSAARFLTVRPVVVGNGTLDATLFQAHGIRVYGACPDGSSEAEVHIESPTEIAVNLFKTASNTGFSAFSIPAGGSAQVFATNLGRADFDIYEGGVSVSVANTIAGSLTAFRNSEICSWTATAFTT